MVFTRKLNVDDHSSLQSSHFIIFIINQGQLSQVADIIALILQIFLLFLSFLSARVALRVGNSLLESSRWVLPAFTCGRV